MCDYHGQFIEIWNLIKENYDSNLDVRNWFIYNHPLVYLNRYTLDIDDQYVE